MSGDRIDRTNVGLREIIIFDELDKELYDVNRNVLILFFSGIVFIHDVNNTLKVEDYRHRIGGVIVLRPRVQWFWNL